MILQQTTSVFQPHLGVSLVHNMVLNHRSDLYEIQNNFSSSKAKHNQTEVLAREEREPLTGSEAPRRAP